VSRFVAVITKPNLHTGCSALAQSGTERSLQRLAEPHVINGKIESLLRCTDECGQPRHHGIGRLFALGEKENGKGIHVGSRK
jgi:hypothetical protein